MQTTTSNNITQAATIHQQLEGKQIYNKYKQLKTRFGRLSGLAAWKQSGTS